MRAGLDAFDDGRFFEAHEHWEDVWRVVSGPERLWIQGLIQLAAALVKMDLDAFTPCGRLALRAAQKLEGAPPGEIASGLGVAVSTVRTQIGNLRLKTGAGSIRALVRQVAVLPPLVSVLRHAAGALQGRP